MYINRHIIELFEKLKKMYSAILITGPRQTGKTTFLEKNLSEIPLLNFDDYSIRDEISNSPKTFFLNHKLPLILDEIQRVPESFLQIKYEIDKTKKKSQIFMTGSEAFSLMENVSESLAGRIGIITLLGLSQREKFNINLFDSFLPDNKYIDKRKKINIDYDLIWNEIFMGSMPELFTNKDFDRKLFWANYITTYIEKDVKEIANIEDTTKFAKFITLLAAECGTILNLTNIANDLNLSIPTINKYISILETSHIIYMLKPYSNNLSKRLIKTPKVYFFDTGLICYLLHWDSVDTLRNGAMAGRILENYCISEIIKSYYNEGDNNPPLYYYRDKDKKEIDLIIEKNQTLYPVEIKKHADPNLHDIKHFKVLEKFDNVKIGQGAELSFLDDPKYITENVRNIPIAYL